MANEKCPAAEGLGGKSYLKTKFKALNFGIFCRGVPFSEYVSPYPSGSWVWEKSSKGDSVSHEVDSERKRKREWKLNQVGTEFQKGPQQGTNLGWAGKT